jgi:hypothetical protein
MITASFLARGSAWGAAMLVAKDIQLAMPA